MKAPATLLTLPEVFRGRLFAIPDYQRGYAWEKPQIQVLHKDIEQLFGADHQHFTGTIVLTENTADARKDDGCGVVYDIIDGQQRLTTLFILVHELIAQLDSGESYEELYDLFISRGEEGNRTPTFELNSQIDPYFKGFVINRQESPKIIEYFSEQRIKICKEVSNNWIEHMQTKQGKSAQDIINLIICKLGFIVYQPENSLEAGMMFEVINNRGKPLSELEKVKNYLLYYAIKQKKRNLRSVIDEKWGQILKSLASASKLQYLDENTFLRGVAVAFFGLNKNQASKIYLELKKRFPVDGDNKNAWKRLEKFIVFMEKSARHYDVLLNEKSVSCPNLNPEISHYIELLRSQSSYANILPLYFVIMNKRDDIEHSILCNILKALEVTNFRIYMARNGAGRTDTGQGGLYGIAHGFYSSFGKHNWWLNNAIKNDEIDYQDNIALLISKLRYLVDKINPDKTFLDGLILDEEDNFDFYRWKGIRYFLMNYERKINSKRTIKIENILQSRKASKSNDFYSIEHIWATQHHLKKKFHNSEDLHQKKRLGNFMLLELGINIQAYSKDISEKVLVFKGNNSTEDASNLKQVYKVIDDYQTTKNEQDIKHANRKGKNYKYNIYTSLIDKNEQRLVAFATERWSIRWADEYAKNDSLAVV